MRYYNPRQPQFQSTFTPAPLDFLQQETENKQGAYDKADLLSHQLLDATGVKARKEDQGAANEIAQKYQTEIDDLGTKVQGDKGSGAYMEGIKDIGRRLNQDLTNGDLAVIKNNKDVFDTYNKQRSDFKDDQGYQEYLDSQYGNLAEGRYKGYKTDSGYNISHVGEIGKQLDWTKKADELIQGIGAESNSGVKFVTDGDGNKYIQDVNGNSVSDQKILNAFVPAFKETEEYKQIQKKAQYLKDNGQIDNTDDYINNQVSNLAKFVTNKYRKSERNVNLSADSYGLQDHQKQIAMVPVPMTGIQAPNAVRQNGITDSASLNTTVQQNTENAASQWAQILHDRPELAQKYGLSSAKAIDDFSTMMFSGKDGSKHMADWMQLHVSELGDSGGALQQLVIDNKHWQELNDGADQYATKISGITPDAMNKIVAANSNSKVAKMTAEDVSSWDNARSILNNAGALDGPAVWAGTALDTPLNRKSWETYSGIQKKYGVGNDVSSNYQLGQVSSLIKDQQGKYDAAKNEYLTQRAAETDSKQYQMDYLPMTGRDSNGNYIDSGTDKNLKKQADQLNTEIRTNMKDGSYDNVMTTIPGFDSKGKSLGRNYTLGEYKLSVANKDSQGQLVMSSVKVTDPFYGTAYNSKNGGQVERQMFVSVNGTSVAIPMDQIIVTKGDGSGVIPLSQIDNNSTNSTAMWLGNTFSYNQEQTVITAPKADPHAAKIVVSNPGSNSSPTNPSSYSNNDKLKVVKYDASGKVLSSATGKDAFEYLQYLQENGELNQ